MAPEYITNGTISAKADIFSLGVIIIELMTGSRDYPWGSEAASRNFIETVRRIGAVFCIYVYISILLFFLKKRKVNNS